MCVCTYAWGVYIYVWTNSPWIKTASFNLPVETEKKNKKQKNPPNHIILGLKNLLIKHEMRWNHRYAVATYSLREKAMFALLSFKENRKFLKEIKKTNKKPKNQKNTHTSKN